MTDGLHASTEAMAAEADQALFGPEPLTPEEASRLLARAPGRLVVFIGERGAGKTSICAELYERQRYAGSDALFAGSWTLLAFERLAHQRRFGGAPLPDAREEIDPHGREILHLALSGGEEPLHLLLADLPGELVRRLADNQISAEEVPWLNRADKLVLMVDGARLRDPTVRSFTLTRVRQIAERISSAGIPKPGVRVALLVSKWDLVGADPAAAAYWAPREAELVEDLRTLDPDAVALRASSHQNGVGDGLAGLRAWLLELGGERDELGLPAWDRGPARFEAPSFTMPPAPMPPPAPMAPLAPGPPLADLPREPAHAHDAELPEMLRWPEPARRRRWLAWGRRR